MKYNYLGTVLVACFIGSMLVVGGAQACKHYPFLAKWMGGNCWLNDVEGFAFKKAGAQPLDVTLVDAGGVQTDGITKDAIYALARTESSDAVVVLRALVLTHESLEIRKAALYALAECMDEAALQQTYSDIALYGDELDLRVAAVYQLGQLGGAEAVAFLTDIAVAPYPLSLRKAAVHALEAEDSDAARKALYTILTNTSAALAG